MSVAANKHYIDTLREKLSDKLTASAMESVLNIADEILASYNVELAVYGDPSSDFFLDAYIDALRVEGKSERTLERYQTELIKILKAMGVSSRDVSAYHIRKYLAEEKERGLADTTIKGKYEVMHSYFSWLHRDGMIRSNPMGNIAVPKVQKKVMETYSEIDYEKLKTGCRKLRDKVIVCFLKSTGCRISEVTNLDRNDIDFANRQFVVLGKGNKERTCYMDEVTAALLKTYLDSRKDLNPALFLGQRGRITQSGIRQMLRLLGKATNVHHVHPHKFRRTKATELSKRGMRVEQIQRILGHEKIDTTMKYVVLDQDDIKYAYRKYS